MGLKQRVVVEEYFIMEIVDITLAYHSYRQNKQTSPKIIIINPKDIEDLKEDYRSQVSMFNTWEGCLMFRGVKVITSVEVPIHTIQIY